MITVRAILLIAAVLCFLCAAVGVQARVQIGWLGLFFGSLAVLIA